MKVSKRSKSSEKEMKVCGICRWWTKHPKGCSEVWEACKGCVIGTLLGYKQEINIGISTQGMTDYEESGGWFFPTVVKHIFIILTIFKCTVQWSLYNTFIMLYNHH